MLKLHINTSTTGATYWAPLINYTNEPLNFTLQYSDIENIQTAVGSYTQTFTLPWTNDLSNLFGDAYLPGYIPENSTQPANNTLLFKQKFPAAIADAQSVFLTGFVQFKNIITTGDRRDLEAVFFADSLNMAKEIGEKLLSELDLSGYDHTLNFSNVQNSWTSSLFSGDVVYGLIDKGFNWSFPDNVPWDSSEGLWMGELTPFIRVKALIDQIFSDAGISYVSDFFNTADFENIYLPAYNGSQGPVSDDSYDNDAAVALPSDYTGTSLAVLNLDDSATNAVDEGGNWDNATDRYTAPENAVYTFNVIYSYSYPVAGSADIYLYKNGSSVQQLDTSFPFTAYNRTETITLTLAAGDYVDLRGQVSGTGARIYGNNVVGSGIRTELKVAASYPFSGQDVTMAMNMPELKQMELLTSLQKMFNLVFIPSGITDQLIIEPYDDYFSTGDEKVWDQKVHRDKSMKMYPTTDLQAKDYQWTYREGLDFISDAVENSLNRVYGAHRVLDPENDFATGSKTLETKVGNYIVSLIPGSSFPIHRSLQADGSAVDNPLPMLAYYCDLSTSFGNWYLRNDSGTTTGPYNQFPLFSPYSSDYPTLTDNDLNFGMESAFIPQQCNPLNTLYYKYWKNYVREFYSESSRIMECTVQLTQSEVRFFRWNDKVFIDGAYWRVLSITTDLNGDGAAKVKLLKALPTNADCADEPTGYDSKNNVILYNGSTGASPDYGSEECCVKYGYVWSGNIVIGGVGYPGVCKKRTQATQPE